MSVARFMALCLSHPEHGYYATRDPLGRDGDFTTAPEISQMFGEMIGAWVAAVWDAIGQPIYRLVELGPGRGTLMSDVLRVTRAVGAVQEVWFVETSPVLRAAQAAKVEGAHWAASLEEVPEGPMILIANEFFDALPVHQYLRDGRIWRERMVGADGERLIWGLSGARPMGAGLSSLDWFERAPLADAVLDQIAHRLAQAPGGAFIADYGYQEADRPSGPTLQALRRHRPADPLDAPGQADLTWLPDFDHIAGRLGPTTKVAEQGAFLAHLGIGRRAEQLARANPDRAGTIADDLERLTAPDQMGRLFKVATVISGAKPAFRTED